MGSSYKRFTGWEPAEVTEHEYEDGVLVRSVTTREAEWDEQERAWMLALAQFESEKCPLCGRHLSICTDPKAEGRIHVPPPTRCHFSTAIENARKPYEGGKAKAINALMFTATLT